MEIKLSPGQKRDSRLNGKGQSKPVRVSFDKQIAEQINRYALTDLKRELGGLLLGSCSDLKTEYQVNIKAAVEAEYTDAAQSSITFTHQSWDHMNQVRESRYPDLKVVGWFHTHPGFGIFLSSHDLFIHQNFFDMPWQVAYVVDPHEESCGMFGWEQKEIVSLPFDIDGKDQPAVQVKKTAGTVYSRHNTGRFLLMLIFLTAFCLMGYSYFLWSDGRRENPYQSPHYPYYGPTIPTPGEAAQMLYTKIMEFSAELYHELTGGRDETSSKDHDKKSDR